MVPATGSFTLSSNAKIYVAPGTPEMIYTGRYLADRLNPSTGYNIRVAATTGTPMGGNIYLTTIGGDPSLGEEGYVLTITRDMVSVVAFQGAGLFRGIQTIRQLLPPSIESATVQPGPWGIAAGMVRDHPRFVWRGTMLDVARHFFTVQDLKRYLDLMAYYKMNRFHLHLTDDQGWRIAINSWSNLATYGGSTAVGGGAGGYFTQAEYSDIVAYAQGRYITVVPEIDMPGHTNAALASYEILNCTGIAPPLYTGIGVGFSALCVTKDTTYAFVTDVVREISALTPGAYIHIGGDEASALSSTDYIRFVERAQAIVQSYGKQMIGWEEIARCHLLAKSVAQHWYSNLALNAVQQGSKVIMSPAERAYLDMKYSPSTALGQDWAGYIEVKDAYSWDPATQVAGVQEGDVLGVEAPLWTETIHTMADIEAMAFPRLAGYAEIGWSPATGRNWDEYKVRLGTHGPRLTAMGVNFYRSPQVPWK
jgi:hexosaminidase